MSSVQLVWLSIAVSAVCVVGLFLKGGRRDVLPYIAAYFAFFGLGPAINFTRDAKIHSLIDVDDIGKASVGLALALAGMSLIGLVVPARTKALDHPTAEDRPRALPLLPVAFFGLSAYALGVIAVRGAEMVQLDKNARVDLAGDWHYRYLLLEFFACSLFFVARRLTLYQVAYWTNLACYTAYCLVTRERDFIFVLFTLLLYLQVLRRRGNVLLLATAAGAFILVATYLASLRSGRAVGVTSTLNEGSVLTVDTLVVGLVPSTYRFLMGQTYLDALLSLFPAAVVGERGSLAEWLIATVAPSSRSGYGFSMTAEAYMNFGPLAIPVIFGGLALIQRFLLARAGEVSPFATYLSMLFTLTWMYNFRGESRAFLVSVVWGVAFYAVVNLRFFPRTRPTRPRYPLPPRSARRPLPLPLPLPSGRSARPEKERDVSLRA